MRNAPTPRMISSGPYLCLCCLETRECSETTPAMCVVICACIMHATVFPAFARFVACELRSLVARRTQRVLVLVRCTEQGGEVAPRPIKRAVAVTSGRVADREPRKQELVEQAHEGTKKLKCTPWVRAGCGFLGRRQVH